jgi:hypothetical protein
MNVPKTIESKITPFKLSAEAKVESSTVKNIIATSQVQETRVESKSIQAVHDWSEDSPLVGARTLRAAKARPLFQSRDRWL